MVNMISIVMIDSRSKIKPEWVNTAINSVKRQMVHCELIIIKNLDRKKTIGECWNEAVRLAKGEYVFFLGDDDYISDDYLFVLSHIAKKTNATMVTSYMTVFRDDMNEAIPYTEVCTGMWKKEYLIENPFNESLTRGVDREYIDKFKLKGGSYVIAQHHYGYFYRKHNEESCAGDITFIKKPEIYIITKYPAFIRPIAKRWKNVYISDKFYPEVADTAKIIWCDFLTENAIKVADYECNAKKILRIHSFDAYSQAIRYTDLSKFKVIYVAEHIKRYVGCEGEVIPNGVDLDKFKFCEKEKNNKIAYVGHITRIKGIGELLLIAKELPDYEFHIAGKFQEEDITQYLNEKKPDNVFLHSWQYDLNEFFKDKTYIINTSLRESQAMSLIEGMACGLKPLVNDWVGSEIYGKYVFKNIKELKGLLEEYNPKEYREFAEQYEFNKIFEKLNGYIQS